MPNMRKQFVDTMTELMKKDEQLVVLLGDIGVHGFRQVFTDHPKRIYNVGILEQSTISMAAGLAIKEMIPVVHTIAPFLVERSYEQLKDDFGYQELNGNFVSVGASYDYAGLGCTHHCPGDVGVLKNIPNMAIIVPGTAREFDRLFKQAYKKKDPKYYRLSEVSNTAEVDVKFGKGHIVKKGKKAVIIAVGPILEKVLSATKDLDVTVLYYTTIRPFDSETLTSCIPKGTKDTKIIICEPYYTGGITWDVLEALKERSVHIDHIGVPHNFINTYGTITDNDAYLGLDTESIKKKISQFLKTNQKPV